MVASCPAAVCPAVALYSAAPWEAVEADWVAAVADLAGLVQPASVANAVVTFVVLVAWRPATVEFWAALDSSSWVHYLWHQASPFAPIAEDCCPQDRWDPAGLQVLTRHSEAYQGAETIADHTSCCLVWGMKTTAAPRGFGAAVSYWVLKDCRVLLGVLVVRTCPAEEARYQVEIEAVAKD